GGLCTLGDAERHDVAAAAAAARTLAPQVVVVGASLGAIAALRHAVDDAGLAGVVTVSAPARWRLRTPRAALAALLTRTGAGRRALRPSPPPAPGAASHRGWGPGSTPPGGGPSHPTSSPAGCPCPSPWFTAPTTGSCPGPRPRSCTRPASGRTHPARSREPGSVRRCAAASTSCPAWATPSAPAAWTRSDRKSVV